MASRNMPAILFPIPGLVPYKGGCVTEPAFFALDHLVNWRADVRIGERTYPDVQVLAFLKTVLAAPTGYGVTQEQAEEARERFLDGAGQALEHEGGQRAWLEREFSART